MHRKFDAQSRHLCDSVLASVQKELPDLGRAEAATWCTFSLPSQSKAFYIRHHSGHVRVWPYWEFETAENLKSVAASIGLEVSARRKQNNTWARRYPLPIILRTDSHVASAIPILLSATSALGRQGKGELTLQRLAHEVPVSKTFIEGAIRTIRVNAYERNPAARLACIHHYGTACSVCGFDFGEIYGEIGEGFIHVHHLKPLSSLGEAYQVDPVVDLRPVCPNCHEMIHSREPSLSIAELSAVIEKRRNPS